METSTLIGFAAIAVAGSGIGFAFGKRLASGKDKLRLAEAEQTAQRLELQAQDKIRQAELKETDVLQKAKEKAIKILEDARLEEKRAVDELKQQQLQLVEREQAFSKKLLEVEEGRVKVEEAKKSLDEKLVKAEAAHAEHVQKLQQVAGLTKDEALQHLINRVEEDHQDALLTRLRKLDEVAADEIDKKAKGILALAVQRQASSHVVETTTTYVEIPTEEMKGRIIGREGRNIKAIEWLTGCEIIIDDTPKVVTVSGFSPIRRQVAKRTLEKLVADGRIQPARIEEMLEESKKELAVDVRKAGEDALYQLGISMAGIDPKFIQILGRLKFRTSYGQNALLHSIEVANLSALLAEELGADVSACKKGGLFHDVGKAVDHDMQGSHPELGYQIMKKYGFPEEICYQSIGHHEDKPKTIEAIIVKAADAISGARPGARKDSLEQYVKRLSDLENLASSFQGVEKVYAIQAGRELRVFVNPTQIDDLAATKLAKQIADKIAAEMKFPGEIRVTLIRESRVIEYAK